MLCSVRGKMFKADTESLRLKAQLRYRRRVGESFHQAGG